MSQILRYHNPSHRRHGQLCRLDYTNKTDEGAVVWVHDNTSSWVQRAHLQPPTDFVFQVGDRVRIASIGHLGTVLEVEKNTLRLEIAGHASSLSCLSIQIDFLERPKDTAVPTFNIGDRIKYFGPHGKMMYGKTGFITKQLTSSDYNIVFDDGTEYSSINSAVLQRSSAPLTPEASRSFLSVFGEVKFTPRWKPIEVPLNSEYTAVVEDSRVVVGCQTFDFSTIERLYKAVEQARTHS